jgi:hypothetical protein
MHSAFVQRVLLRLRLALSPHWDRFVIDGVAISYVQRARVAVAVGK